MSRSDANATAEKLTKRDWTVLALLGASGGFYLLASCVGRYWMVPEMFVSLSVATLLLYYGLWPSCMTQHYWRRSHPALRLAWLPAGWIAAYPLMLLPFPLMPIHYTPVAERIGEVWLFWVAPPVLLAGVLAVRKCRSDTQLFLAACWPGLVLAIGVIGLVLTLLGFTQHEFFDDVTTWGVMIVSSAILALPSVICLAALQMRRRLGTSPDASPLCIRCGYDLSGSVPAGSKQCPECGEAIRQAQEDWVMRHPSASIEVTT